MSSQLLSSVCVGLCFHVRCFPHSLLVLGFLLKNWTLEALCLAVGIAALAFRNSAARVSHLTPVECPCLDDLSVPQPKTLYSIMHLPSSAVGQGGEACLHSVAERSGDLSAP